MRAQSARYAHLVYIFQGDAVRMKRKPGTKWNLYGLWTHSSSPVVQCICEEREISSAESLGLELLGQCLPQSTTLRQEAVRSHNGQKKLIVYNDGQELKAVLVQRNGLAPARCPVKELPMESPFTNHPHVSQLSRGNRETSPHYRSQVVASEENVPTDELSKRKSGSPVNRYQWYSTSDGEAILRNINNYCIAHFPTPSVVAMSRDAETHDFILSIKHSNKTYNIYFPSNFPQSSAHILYNTAIYTDIKLHHEAKSKEDIVQAIKNHCRCYKCGRR